MSDPHERSLRLLAMLDRLMKDSSSLNFSDFRNVSDSMLEGYAHFVRQGMPGETIGLAMLGATINLYDMLGMRGDLPDLLRNLADKLESESSTN